MSPYYPVALDLGGRPCTVLGGGPLALEKVQEVRPDLVLCNIIMPEKDGYEVCDVIKKNPATAHIPVLLLTGAFEPFDQERANASRKVAHVVPHGRSIVVAA